MPEPVESAGTPVIVVCRNNLSLTKITVHSIEAQDSPVEIIAVDNASSDGTAAWLASRDFATISFGGQMSLAACWNAGLRAAWKAGWDRALVCNNDVHLRPDTARLLSTHPGPFVTCVSVGDERQLEWPEDPQASRARVERTRPHPDVSCFLISKSVTDAIGWFDERYFPAYCEDSDFHVRMYRAGLWAGCIDLPFLHFASSTLKSAEKGEAARIRRGADANRERFRRAYGCLPGTKEYEALFTSAEEAAPLQTEAEPRAQETPDALVDSTPTVRGGSSRRARTKARAKNS